VRPPGDATSSYRSDLGLRDSGAGGALPNERLQLPPNSSLQSIRGSILAAAAVPQRSRSAVSGAAGMPVGWAAVSASPTDGWVLCIVGGSRESGIRPRSALYG
jgi:hypothetical protein